MEEKWGEEKEETRSQQSHPYFPMLPKRAEAGSQGASLPD